MGQGVNQFGGLWFAVNTAGQAAQETTAGTAGTAGLPTSSAGSRDGEHLAVDYDLAARLATVG